MHPRTRPQADTRHAPTIDRLGLALAIAAILAAFVGTTGARSAGVVSPPRTSFVDVPGGPRGAAGAADGVVGEADGLVPDGTSVFGDVPAVANLDPEFLEALRRAASEAGRVGVELNVNSGWRSPEYQELLLRQAVSAYGSEKAAARWVGTAETSAHVSGDAVDVGPAGAAAWLSEHGARFGLCQIYANEPWHYELRRAAISRGCPAMYADPTRDPRMRQ